MLVLARKVGERIMVGEEVVITVIDVRNGQVRLGVEAPKTMAVDREEVRKNKRAGEGGGTCRR